MPNRILKDSICTSESVDDLSSEAENFFYRLIVQCDDFGRFDARPAVLRARCFPLRLHKVTEEHIAKWLQELIKAKTIQVYKVGGKPYLQFIAWDDHQQVRAKRSKYPAPQEADSNGNHPQADDSKCGVNPIQSNPKESNGNGASAAAAPPVSVPSDIDTLQAAYDWLDAHTAVKDQQRLLARLYEKRFKVPGEPFIEPDYARLTKMAKDLSGTYKTLARIIWQASIPEGDPHDYLAGIIRKSKARKAEAEEASAVY